MNENRSAEMSLRASRSSSSRLTNLISRSAVLAGLISAGGTTRSSAQKNCACAVVTVAPVAASIAVVVPANFTKSRRDVVVPLLPTGSLKLHGSLVSCQGELPLRLVHYRLIQCSGIA